MAGTSVEALSTAAETLVANGYGTSSTVRKIEALGDALGCPVRCMVEWEQISLTTPEGDPVATLQVRPENINMSKVSATLRIIDAAVHDAEPKSRAIADDLERAAELPATPTPWFVFACAAGACGLGAIFGAHTPAAYVLIALAAALGGLLRRALGRHGVAATAQAICAALVAGVVGGIGAHLGISSAARLVAVCPAMVLVPGPHLINGMIDVAERHLQVGLARIAYGATTLIGIGIGLVLGLATTGTDLPITAPGVQVALPIDILGAASPPRPIRCTSRCRAVTSSGQSSWVRRSRRPMGSHLPRREPSDRS